MFIETHRTARGGLVLNLYFRDSGKLGPGPQEVGRSSLSRRVHVKVKGTLDSVEQKNYAVGEQRERDTKGWSALEANKLRSFVEAESWAGVIQRARLVLWSQQVAFGLSWKSRAGGPTNSTLPTRASDSEAGLSQRTGSDCAPIHRYV